MQPDQGFHTACPDGAHNCLGVGYRLNDGQITLSKMVDGQPVGPQIHLTSDEWRVFLQGAKAGEFDIPET